MRVVAESVRLQYVPIVAPAAHAKRIACVFAPAATVGAHDLSKRIAQTEKEDLPKSIEDRNQCLMDRRAVAY
jgi:hypothetical protein